jgi:hypothetical protein
MEYRFPCNHLLERLRNAFSFFRVPLISKQESQARELAIRYAPFQNLINEENRHSRSRGRHFNYCFHSKRKRKTGRESTEELHTFTPFMVQKSQTLAPYSPQVVLNIASTNSTARSFIENWFAAQRLLTKAYLCLATLELPALDSISIA